MLKLALFGSSFTFPGFLDYIMRGMVLLNMNLLCSSVGIYTNSLTQLLSNLKICFLLGSEGVRDSYVCVINT